MGSKTVDGFALGLGVRPAPAVGRPLGPSLGTELLATDGSLLGDVLRVGDTLGGTKPSSDGGGLGISLGSDVGFAEPI